MSGTVRPSPIRNHPQSHDTPRTTNPAHAGRISALDFTKGALVFFMVIYHWINYFIGIQWPYYRYLRFLTPSFIFIAGFIVSNIYLRKYEVSDPRLANRLLIRGSKLLAVFISLNAARNLLLPILFSHIALPNLLEYPNLRAIFLTGDFTSKVVSFSILVPIAYLLMLSGVILALARLLRASSRSCGYIALAIAACLFIGIIMVDLRGSKAPLLEVVAVGMLGILAGFRPISAINRTVRRPFWLIVGYVFYIIAITIWDVPYPLEVVGTCLSVIIIYLVGTVDRPSWVRNEVILLGKYSLWGYVSQIAILQILAAVFRHANVGRATPIVSFLAALALTVAAVEAVHWARAKTGTMDWLYRTVFA